MFKLLVILMVLGVIAWILAKVMFFLIIASVIVVVWICWNVMGSRGRRF